MLPRLLPGILLFGIFFSRKKAFERRIIVDDPTEVAATRARIVSDGFSKLHVVIDFDRTITTFLHRGSPGATCHNILEARRGEATLAACAALNRHYYPFETSASLRNEEKVPHMKDWYSRVNGILAGCGITREDLQEDVRLAGFSLRRGVMELLHAAGRHGFPVTIFSAGIGDVIEEALRQRCYGGMGAQLPPNVRVVSNRMQWEGAVCVGFSEKVLHPFNKNFREAADFLPPEYLEQLGSRSNVVVVGDGEGDANMADGLGASAVLKVGLLNDPSNTLLLDRYRRIFDVLCA